MLLFYLEVIAALGDIKVFNITAKECLTVVDVTVQITQVIVGHDRLVPRVLVIIIIRLVAAALLQILLVDDARVLLSLLRLLDLFLFSLRLEWQEVLSEAEVLLVALVVA